MCSDDGASTHSAWRPVRTVRIDKFRVKVTAPLRCEIENVVHRGQQVDSAFLDILRHPGVCGVNMSESAVAIAREDRDGRVLVALRVLAAKVVFEGAVPATKQPKVAPPSIASMLAQGRWICGGSDDEVDVLGEMKTDAVVAVDPHRAHRAGAGLT